LSKTALPDTPEVEVKEIFVNKSIYMPDKQIVKIKKQI